MHQEIGLWIDDREAIIVILTDGGEEINHMISNSEKHIRYSGSSHSPAPEGIKDAKLKDQRDRKFETQLNKCYHEVIASIQVANSIQESGPGEGKGGLERSLEPEGLKEHVIIIETADQMTVHQIAAKVRSHFLS